MTMMTVEDLRPVALWAADCAERALPLYERAAPGDHRAREAIEAARVFAHGQRRDKRSEIDWAVKHSTHVVRAVVTAMPAPVAGRTRLGDLYRALDNALRHPRGPAGSRSPQ